MSANDAVLHCFAYGEHLDGLAQRSLGYRLLAPTRPEPWCAEVEALARRLQATLDFRVGALLQRFHLSDPNPKQDPDLLRKLAAGGHFGRPDLALAWEAGDLARQLK